MTTAVVEAPSYLIGAQRPRIEVVPEGDPGRGDLAVEFCRAVGMTLYPWQEDLLRDMCLTDEAGMWSAREAVVSLSRQNGKGEVLVARELVGVYLFGEHRILHTAHFLDTAMDARDRLFEVISNSRELMQWWSDSPDEVPRVILSNGKDAIHFPNGAKIYYRTRTKKTGRGLSVDLLVFDECFDLPNEVYAAMNSVTKARPNAQKIFISSPVNRFEHVHGAIFSAKRWAGIDGAEGILFKEWSPEPGADPFDFDTWVAANPSLVNEPKPGVQLSEVRLDAASASKSLDLRDSFLVETLGMGNWVPRDDEQGDFTPILDVDEWAACVDGEPEATGDSVIGIDVAPDGDVCALVAAVKTKRGVHLSLSPVVDFDRDRVVGNVKRSVEVNDPAAVVLDAKGPASTLVTPLGREGVEPELIKWSQITAALELFLALFSEGRISHDGNPRWIEALEVAQFRDGNSNGRALTRREGTVCQIVAATFAVWGLEQFGAMDSKPDVKAVKRHVGSARAVKRSRSVVDSDF